MDTNLTEKIWNKKEIKELCSYKISKGNNHVWQDKENELCATFFVKNPNN